MGAKFFIGTPWLRNEVVLKIGMGYVKKCIVSMATHRGFENGGMPTIPHISAVIEAPQGWGSVLP